MRRWALLAAMAGILAGQTKPQYEVFAVRYATIPDFAVSGLVAGVEASRKMDIAMMVWLVRGGGKNILVDSGFYREQFFRQWHVTDYVKPSEAVRRAGVKPEEITDVIVTHMHWDHADGMDLFPNARIWVQKEELEYYAGSAWQSRRTHGGIDPDDVLAAVKLNMAGKVGLVDGDAQEILPGITCYTGGKHTLRVAVCRGEHERRDGGAGQRQRVPLRKSGEARADCGDAGCGVESAGAGPDEATGGGCEADSAGARSGGDDAVPGGGAGGGAGAVMASTRCGADWCCATVTAHGIRPHGAVSTGPAEARSVHRARLGLASAAPLG